MEVLIDGVPYAKAETKTYSIGIGITTHNRHGLAIQTYEKILKLTPNAKIIIVDDGSAEPLEIIGAEVYRFDNNAVSYTHLTLPTIYSV